jgi:hypothetical protein
MASPFTVFRKNQKILMAMACLLAIIAFVFLPNLGNFGLGDRGRKNEVVLACNYGDLRESDVWALLQHHRKIMGVLAEIKLAAGEYPVLARLWAEQLIGPATEENVVNSWLLARYAQRLGMVIDDPQVIAFLKRWTKDSVKPSDFQQAFKRSGLTEIQFLKLMSDVLAAQQLREMFAVSLVGMTPGQRWDYFARVKQTAAIEAVPVPVADYLSRVDEPTEDELKAFFEKHKEEYSRPESPEPGFREPQKVALQWFKASHEKLLASVTQDEIKQRYENNKKLYEESEKKPEEKQPEEKKKQPEDKKKETLSAKGAKNTKAEKDSKNAKVDKDNKSVDNKNTKVEKDAKTAKEDKPAVAKPGMAEATKNRIRREIADEKIGKVLDKLRGQMDRYRALWSEYKVAMLQQQGRKPGEKDQVKLPQVPARPDFAKLAKENGLSTEQTPLMSQWEARASDIGGSLVGGRDPVAHCAFAMAEFRAETSTSMSGDLYLFWKVQETKDRVPKFDDPGVREHVLQTFKMIDARRLAIKAAEALAAEARQAKKPLKEAFAGRGELRVLTPPAFSWVTFGNVPLGSAPEAARISDVKGVEFPGDEFMRTVFRLEPGGTGVAINAPQSVVYVIWLKEFTPSFRVLWKEFEVDDFSKYAPAAMDDRQRTYRAWLDEIKAATGAEWKRKPDRMTEYSGPRDED